MQQVNVLPQSKFISILTTLRGFFNMRHWQSQATARATNTTPFVPAMPAQTVEVDITPVFSGNSRRPTHFEIRQKYGNGQFVRRTPDIQN